jgi:hypothetical protein
MVHPFAFRREGLVLLTLAMAFVGCDCRKGPGVTSNYGEIGVIWRDDQANRVINRDATYDFGHALTGEKKNLTMSVTNLGAGSLTLKTLALTSGDPTIIGSDVPANPAFEVQFKETVLGSSEQVDFPMYFTPTQLKSVFEADLTLTAEGTRAEDATAKVTLKGGGEAGACDLPTTIDFGAVTVGEKFPYALLLRNPTTIDATAHVGDITGADAAAFVAAPTGDISVPAMTVGQSIISFSPTEKRDYTAQVIAHGVGTCPDVTITLKGTGSDAVLTWSPSSLDFGAVPPGDEGDRDVVFVNPANAPVTLTMVQTSMPTDFSHKVTAGVDPTTFTIPGGSVPTPLTVACSPSGFGARTANLTFTTGLVKVPNGTVALTCKGGGPKIKVTPDPTLDFGQVGYFPATPTFNVSRKVTIQNVGTYDTSANLFLGEVVNGVPGQGAPFDLTGPDAAEFSVSLASTYPTTGIPALAGSNFVDLKVTLTPQSVGMKTATLTIYSNDSSTPTKVITINANAQQLPPCNYSVSPATANFGLVSPGTTKDLAVTITNLGQGANDLCYLSGIDLQAGSNTAFSIVGGPVVDKTLNPGESWPVVVRVTPPGPVPATLVTLTGTLQFNASSPTNPQGLVPVRASMGPTCLVVTPDPLDFGTVKMGCASAPRTFTLYNTCTANVTLKSFSMQAAGGQPAGGPNCPGTSACPEFSLVSTPTIPSGGLSVTTGGTPVNFQVKYAPIDLGTDTGAVAIDAVQSGQSVTYLVGLQGTGDTSGQQTDTFVQDAQPKADVLLVIDDSGSMQDKQTSLSNNFTSFMQYALSANVDYQIGVITTTNDMNDCPANLGCTTVAMGGSLYQNASAGIPKFITPRTPSVATVFSKMVKVGTDGSGIERGFEPAVSALTPPKIAAENAGFLRTDANLAVVVVSDASDQSAQPVSYYQNRLVNVKGFNKLSMFTFNNIGPYDPNIDEYSTPCAYDGDHDPSRYASVVAYTSGVKGEICTTNWSGTLQGLGRTTFGARTQFFLNNTPDLNGNSIVVQINGTNVALSNTCTNATTPACYDAASNSIKFSPASAAPQPGQTLTVTYTNACF